MISARYVADCLFLRDFKPIPGILITNLIILLIILVPSPYYFIHFSRR